MSEQSIASIKGDGNIDLGDITEEVNKVLIERVTSLVTEVSVQAAIIEKLCNTVLYLSAKLGEATAEPASGNPDGH